MVPFVTEQQYNAETLAKGILSMRNMFIAKKPNKSFKPSKPLKNEQGEMKMKHLWEIF